MYGIFLSIEEREPLFDLFIFIGGFVGGIVCIEDFWKDKNDEQGQYGAGDYRNYQSRLAEIAVHRYAALYRADNSKDKSYRRTEYGEYHRAYGKRTVISVLLCRHCRKRRSAAVRAGLSIRVYRLSAFAAKGGLLLADRRTAGRAHIFAAAQDISAFTAVNRLSADCRSSAVGTNGTAGRDTFAAFGTNYRIRSRLNMSAAFRAEGSARSQRSAAFCTYLF